MQVVTIRTRRIRKLGPSAGRRHVAMVAFGLLLAALDPADAAGQTVINWRNANGGAYAIANNWDPANVPQRPDETARFGLDATYDVAISGNTATTISDLLVVDGDVSFRVSGISNNATLRTDDDTIINNATLTLDKPATFFRTLTLEVDDLLRVEDGGTLDILDGSDVNAAQLWVAPGSSDRLAEVTVSGTGSTLTAPAALDVGFSGEGSLTISDGASASSLVSLIGDQFGSVGNVTVSGNNSIWTEGFWLRIGREGMGTLSIDDSGMVSSPDIDVGVNQSGDGRIIVNGRDSSLEVTSELTVGESGSGMLRIEESGTVTSAESRIATGSDGNGDVTVIDTGSTWTTADLTVGHEAVGTLRVQAGGAVDSGHTYIGRQTAGDGSVTVTGSGSMWTNTELDVGRSGAGTLLIEAGGNVMTTGTTDTTIGTNASSRGDATVTGTGSDWTIAGGLTVGDLGKGTMTVANGATMTNPLGIVGSGLNSLGIVTVTGPGAIWTSATDVVVGVDGTATLNVNNAGTVDVADDLQIGPLGTVNLAGGTIVVSNIVFTGSTFNFIGGTLHLRNDHVVTFTRAVELGVQTLGVGKTLLVDGLTTLQTSVVLDGGTLTTGSISGGENVTLLPYGTLNVLDQSIAIGESRPLGDTLNVPNGATVNIAQGLNNQGLVTGGGTIGGSFTNNRTGEVRVTAGTTLTFTGAGNSNLGVINILGGVVVHTEPFTNEESGLIAGHGSLVTARLTNSGTMALSGVADVLGDVVNRSGATIISTGGGPTTFFDNVTNDGEIRTSEGGFTVFLGAVDGRGEFPGQGAVNFEGDLKPGASPAVVPFGGNVTFTHSATLEMELGGVLTGGFDRLDIAGTATLEGTLDVLPLPEYNDPIRQGSFHLFELITADNTVGTFEDVTYDGDSVAAIDPDNPNSVHSHVGNGLFRTLNYTGKSVEWVNYLAIPGDANGDRIVGATDFEIWNTYSFTSGTNWTTGDFNGDGVTDVSDFNVWNSNRGATAFAAIVPEPSGYILWQLAFVGLVAIRRVWR